MTHRYGARKPIERDLAPRGLLSRVVGKRILRFQCDVLRLAEERQEARPRPVSITGKITQSVILYGGCSVESHEVLAATTAEHFPSSMKIREVRSRQCTLFTLEWRYSVALHIVAEWSKSPSRTQDHSHLPRELKWSGKSMSTTQVRIFKDIPGVLITGSSRWDDPASMTPTCTFGFSASLQCIEWVNKQPQVAIRTDSLTGRPMLCQQFHRLLELSITATQTCMRPTNL